MYIRKQKFFHHSTTYCPLPVPFSNTNFDSNAEAAEFGPQARFRQDPQGPTGEERCKAEVHLLLAREGSGSGTTLEVDGAIKQRGNRFSTVTSTHWTLRSVIWRWRSATMRMHSSTE